MVGSSFTSINVFLFLSVSLPWWACTGIHVAEDKEGEAELPVQPTCTFLESEEKQKDALGNFLYVTQWEDSVAQKIIDFLSEDTAASLPTRNALVKLWKVTLLNLDVDKAFQNAPEIPPEGKPSKAELMQKAKEVKSILFDLNHNNVISANSGPLLMSLSFAQPGPAEDGLLRLLLDSDFWDKTSEEKKAVDAIKGNKVEYPMFDENKGRAGKSDSATKLKTLSDRADKFGGYSDAQCEERAMTLRLGITYIADELAEGTHELQVGGKTMLDQWKEALDKLNSDSLKYRNKNECKVLLKARVLFHMKAKASTNEVARAFKNCRVPWTGGMSGSILEQMAFFFYKSDALHTPGVLLTLMAALDTIGAHSFSEMVPIAQEFFRNAKVASDVQLEALKAAWGEGVYQAFMAIPEPFSLKTGCATCPDLQHVTDYNSATNPIISFLDAFEKFVDDTRRFVATTP